MCEGRDDDDLAILSELTFARVPRLVHRTFPNIEGYHYWQEGLKSRERLLRFLMVSKGKR
jgi:hypothetical protein